MGFPSFHSRAGAVFRGPLAIPPFCRRKSVFEFLATSLIGTLLLGLGLGFVRSQHCLLPVLDHSSLFFFFPLVLSHQSWVFLIGSWLMCGRSKSVEGLPPRLLASGVLAKPHIVCCSESGHLQSLFRWFGLECPLSPWSRWWFRRRSRSVRGCFCAVLFGCRGFLGLGNGSRLLSSPLTAILAVFFYTKPYFYWLMLWTVTFATF